MAEPLVPQQIRPQSFSWTSQVISGGLILRPPENARLDDLVGEVERLGLEWVPDRLSFFCPRETLLRFVTWGYLRGIRCNPRSRGARND